MPTLEEISIPHDSLAEQVEPATLFGNDRPIELEIGCGKGTFLLRQAQAHPDRNFLGIEWANKFYKFAADRMARWGVENVRIIRTDASHFVMNRLPPACLAALHIYHPDPWPKKRHHKRRLIQTDFMDAAVRVLAPAGRLALQTDHAGYFEQMKAVTSVRSELVPIAFEDAEFGTTGERTETNYEIKYLREGRPIYRLAFRRSS